MVLKIGTFCVFLPHTWYHWHDVGLRKVFSLKHVPAAHSVWQDIIPMIDWRWQSYVKQRKHIGLLLETPQRLPSTSLDNHHDHVSVWPRRRWSGPCPWPSWSSSSLAPSVSSPSVTRTCCRGGSGEKYELQKEERVWEEQNKRRRRLKLRFRGSNTSWRHFILGGILCGIKPCLE